jgi:CrcB protein
MKELSRYLIVAFGGALGAVARYALGGWVQAKWGAAFPYGTFIINISGAFVLGLFATLFVNLAWNDQWRLLIAVGFLGAYTTFSTFQYESLELITQGGRYRAAVLYLVGSLVVGLLTAYLGIVAARLLLSLRGGGRLG